MKKVLPLSALTLSTIVLVACGSSSSSSTSTTVSCGPGAGFAGGGGQRLKLSAVPSEAPKYNTKSLTAKSGKVTIDFNNPSSNCHDVAVKDQAGKVYGVSSRIKKSKTSVKLNLKPGTYIYYSTVPGDTAGTTPVEPSSSGMVGTLTVK